jgi:hypothetical protein
MVGRIEIVTPEQRATLRELAAPATAVNQAGADHRAALLQKLGRFADALVLDDRKRRAKEAP